MAIKDHPQGAFKESDVVTIKALRTSPCHCQNTDIHIGLYSNTKTSFCPICKSYLREATEEWWFNENSFAPLDSLADISELTEHLETTKPFEI